LVNKEEKYSPKAGDIVWIDMSPQKGHEQGGRRPALVLSQEEYNRKTGLAIFCPVTNQNKGYPFEVEIPSGLSISGVILSDHIKNLDWKSRKAEFICSLDDEEVINDVLAKISILIDI